MGLPDAYVIARTEVDLEEKEKEEERERRRVARRVAEEAKEVEKKPESTKEKEEVPNEDDKSAPKDNSLKVDGATGSKSKEEGDKEESVNEAAETEDDDVNEDDEALWAPPRQLSVAEFLNPGEFVFLPPAR